MISEEQLQEWETAAQGLADPLPGHDVSLLIAEVRRLRRALDVIASTPSETPDGWQRCSHSGWARAVLTQGSETAT